MGLDFDFPGRRGPADENENAPHWSYTGFNEFRRRLAAEIGINLREMRGYGVDIPGWRSWDDLDDPIKPLLNHSDCEGVLTPSECATVAPRLRTLISKWNNYDKGMALRLADAMDACVQAGVDLEFC